MMVPKTIEDAMKILTPMFNGMSELHTKTEDEFAAFCHSQLSGGIGMRIRNQFGFWTAPSSTLYKELETMGLKDADAKSDHLIRLIYRTYEIL